MFKSVIKLVVFLTVILLIGCVPDGRQIVINGSDSVVTQDKPLSGFDGVSVSQSFHVDIHQGKEFSVLVRVDEQLAEYVEVIRQGDTLRIGLNPDYSYTTTNATMQAEVTMPELTGLHLSGSSRATIDGFESGKSLTVEQSGSSSVRGTIRAGDTVVELSGSSRVTLTGAASALTVRASGSSRADLSSFPADSASVKSSGASEVTVSVSDRLQASASGASQVYYRGNPASTRADTSGSASVAQEY